MDFGVLHMPGFLRRVTGCVLGLSGVGRCMLPCASMSPEVFWCSGPTGMAMGWCEGSGSEKLALFGGEKYLGD